MTISKYSRKWCNIQGDVSSKRVKRGKGLDPIPLYFWRHNPSIKAHARSLISLLIASSSTKKGNEYHNLQIIHDENEIARSHSALFYPQAYVQ